MFSLCLCARFQASSKTLHLHAVRELLDMLEKHLVLAYFILSIYLLNSLGIMMRILPEAK